MGRNVKIVLRIKNLGKEEKRGYLKMVGNKFHTLGLPVAHRPWATLFTSIGGFVIWIKEVWIR